MSLPVLLTDGAARDLDERYAAAYARGGAAAANRMLDQIQTALLEAAEGRVAGAPVPELARLGMRDEREVRAGRYRILYRERAGALRVALILEAGRSIQPLLQRRLLDA